MDRELTQEEIERRAAETLRRMLTTPRPAAKPAREPPPEKKDGAADGKPTRRTKSRADKRPEVNDA